MSAETEEEIDDVMAEPEPKPKKKAEAHPRRAICKKHSEGRFRVCYENRPRTPIVNKAGRYIDGGSKLAHSARDLAIAVNQGRCGGVVWPDEEGFEDALKAAREVLKNR